MISDLPEIDTVDQTAIEEGALQVKSIKNENQIPFKYRIFGGYNRDILVQVKANTELAVAEIENLNQVNHDVLMIPSKDAQTTMLL